MRHVPLGLVVLRFLLALLCLAFGLLRHSISVPGTVFVVILVVGVLSDIFDGVIARRLGVADERLRRLDSRTDIIFWACAVTAAWLLHPDIVWAHGIELAILLGFEIVIYLVSWVRFGKEASPHAYTAKAYGLGLLIGMTAVLGFGQGGLAVHIMFAAGFVAGLDALAIILLLPTWACDVPSSLHALRARLSV